MKPENKTSLINLAKTCRNSGMLPIFLGLSIFFIDLFFGQFAHALIGVLVFIMGYSFFKIAAKIRDIVGTEE